MFDYESNFKAVRNHTNIDFSLIIPTRTLGRQKWLKKCLKSFFGKAEMPSRVEAILLMDLDDILSCRATQKFCLEKGYNIQIIIKPRDQQLFTQSYQCHGAQCSTGKYIWALNDECEMMTEGWDTIISAAGDEFFERVRSSVMYISIDDDTHTGRKKNKGCCFPIVSLATAEALNGNFPAEISNWGADTSLYQVFRMSCPDHIIDLSKEIKVLHHCHHNGRRERDELNIDVEKNSGHSYLDESELDRYSNRLRLVIRSEVEPFNFWIEENLITKFNAVPDVRVPRPSTLQRLFYHIRKRLGCRETP